MVLPREAEDVQEDSLSSDASGADHGPRNKPASAQPLLERWGVRYFRALSRDVSVVDVDGVHFLNSAERAGLRAVVRGAVTRAAVAGALSTLVSAGAEVLATPLLETAGNDSAGAMRVRFWLIVVGATALASVIEIAYLYWDGLRSVHRMAVVAGLDLFGQPIVTDPADPNRPSRSERVAVAEGLARAALELPNPVGQVFGINPRREASRLELALASIVYKLKISVTNFLVKALVRRAVGRTALRGWLSALVPFAAVPVTAAWNGIVAWLVLREARIRTMGPSAAGELITFVLAGNHPNEMTLAARHMLVRAVACSIVRTQDLHPNLVGLLETLAARLRVDPTEDIDDAARFVKELVRVEPAEQRRALRMLCVAAIIDGRVSRRERRLVLEAFRACGLPSDLAALERLRSAFVRGDRLVSERVEELA